MDIPGVGVFSLCEDEAHQVYMNRLICIYNFSNHAFYIYMIVHRLWGLLQLFVFVSMDSMLLRVSFHARISDHYGR